MVNGASRPIAVEQLKPEAERLKISLHLLQSFSSFDRQDASGCEITIDPLPNEVVGCEITDIRLNIGNHSLNVDEALGEGRFDTSGPRGVCNEKAQTNEKQEPRDGARLPQKGDDDCGDRSQCAQRIYSRTTSKQST